nr:uncharacterized protein LOC126055632 [Helicoverpa armigera]
MVMPVPDEEKWKNIEKEFFEKWNYPNRIGALDGKHVEILAPPETEVFNWTPQQKLVIARKSLCGTAALWLGSEKVFRSYDELKTALLKEFLEHLNSKEMHELISTRKKKKDESYYQYMLVMKELGNRAKFPDYVAIQSA